MSVAVELMRIMFTGIVMIEHLPILIGVVSSLIVLVGWLFVFNRVQCNFVDTV